MHQLSHAESGLISSLFSNENSQCLAQFYQDTPPYLNKESLKKKAFPICFNGFNVMYSGLSKTPLWSADHLTIERLSQRIKREDHFHEETKIPAIYRSTLQDYRASGYDRGHMSPNADMSNTTSQYDSFSLANIVPQAPKNNQEVWRKLEEATRAVVKKHKQDVYVVTGPIYSSKRLNQIGNGVLVPNAIFKAVYFPKTDIIGAYYAVNNNSQQVHITSICEIEDLTGMNLFPTLTEQKKRKIYQLPLDANDVKTNKKIEYLNWDAQSQCAEDVADDQLLALKKQFKPVGVLHDISFDQAASQSNSAEQSEPKDGSILQNLIHKIMKDLQDSIITAILKLFKSGV
ncbi:MAG: DNA/RNA non-specific endonuclease [Acinetobacter sp.]